MMPTKPLDLKIVKLRTKNRKGSNTVATALWQIVSVQPEVDLTPEEKQRVCELALAAHKLKKRQKLPITFQDKDGNEVKTFESFKAAQEMFLATCKAKGWDPAAPEQAEEKEPKTLSIILTIPGANFNKVAAKETSSTDGDSKGDEGEEEEDGTEEHSSTA